MHLFVEEPEWDGTDTGTTSASDQLDGRQVVVVVLGVILLILGWLLGVSILWTIGIILIVIGLVLWILGAMGRAVGGRPHYW